MTRELSRYLTVLIADDIDNRPYINMDMSSCECERLEAMFVKEDFSAIQKFLENKLLQDKQNEIEL